MATNAEVLAWLQSNPNASDAKIAATARAAGVSPTQLSQVTGVPVAEVASRMASSGLTDTQINSVAKALTPAATDPYRVAQAVTGLGLSADDIVKIGQAINPNATAQDITDYFQNAGIDVGQTLSSGALASQSGLLNSGGLEGEYGNRAFNLNPAIVDRVYGQIMNQYNAGTSQYYSGQGFGSNEANIMDMAKNLVASGITDINQVGQNDQGKIINKQTGEQLLSNYAERTNRSDMPDAFSGTFAGDGNTGYRVSFDDKGNPIFYTTGASSNDLATLLQNNKLLNIAANIAAAYFGGPIGSAALQLAQGNDIGDAAKAALLTYGGQQITNLFNTPTDSIYSLANGPSNLDYMGGGQGLTSTTGAGLESMGGAQGITILSGAQSASLADALSSFGGVNPKVLSDMGLGQGITYVTPSGIVTENGTIIGGDVISEFGKNTGFNLDNWLNQNVGGAIGDELKYLDTGVNSDQVDLGSTTLDNSIDKTTTTTTTTTSSASDLLKLASAAGMLNTAGNIGGGGGGAPVNPTQGVPVNNPAYYQAIQQYYNTYMPNQPADVATPLQQWYSGAYKA